MASNVNVSTRRMVTKTADGEISKFIRVAVSHFYCIPPQNMDEGFRCSTFEFCVRNVGMAISRLWPRRTFEFLNLDQSRLARPFLPVLASRLTSLIQSPARWTLDEAVVLHAFRKAPSTIQYVVSSKHNEFTH